MCQEQITDVRDTELLDVSLTLQSGEYHFLPSPWWETSSKIRRAGEALRGRVSRDRRGALHWRKERSRQGARWVAGLEAGRGGGCTPRTQRSQAERSCTGRCEMSRRNGWETDLSSSEGSLWIALSNPLQMQELVPTPDLLNYNLHFNKTPRPSICTWVCGLKLGHVEPFRSWKGILNPLSQGQYQIFVPLGSCPDSRKLLELYSCRWQKCTWPQLLDRRLLEMRDYI